MLTKEGVTCYFLAEVPLPPKELSPNFPSHWAKKGRFVRAYREACWVEFLRVARRGHYRKDGPCPAKLVLNVGFYTCRRSAKQGFFQPKDEDNARASLKAMVDALKDARVIESDAKERLVWGEFELVTTERELERQNRPPGVVVMLTVP